MKYFVTIFIIMFVACNAPENKVDESYSTQNFENAKKCVDSIHVLMRKGVAKELALGQIEPRILALKDSVKKYAASVSAKDSAELVNYESKKQNETMEWMTKNGYQ